MSTRRALLFSFVDRYSGMFLSIVSSMVLARMLTPADIGVFSVASALLILASAVRDMGAGQYLVQAKQLDNDQIRAVWTIQVAVGLLLAVVVAGLAIPAAAFYREPRMTPVLLVMAGTFLINPVGAITYAMLMRQMRFQQVAVMRFCANLAGFIVSLYLAFRDWGPMSLAVGALASTATNALVAQLYRDRSMPWGFSLGGVSQALGFGGRIAGTQVVNNLLLATPDFALGKLQSVHAAGLYSRSVGLVAMFDRLVTVAVYNVAVAMFSEQSRAGKSLAEGMLRPLSYITVLHWAFAVNVMFLADPLTLALYGSQWGESVELTRILALAGALTAPVPICVAVTTALGRADRVFKISLGVGLITAAATLVGASISLRAMAVGVSGASLISGVTWLILTCKLTGCSVSDVARVLARSALVAGICALVPLGFVLSFGLQPASPWAILIAATVCGIVTLLVVLLKSRHPLANELQPLLQKLPLKK